MKHVCTSKRYHGDILKNLIRNAENNKFFDIMPDFEINIKVSNLPEKFQKLETKVTSVHSVTKCCHKSPKEFGGSRDTVEL